MILWVSNLDCSQRSCSVRVSEAPWCFHSQLDVSTLTQVSIGWLSAKHQASFSGDGHTSALMQLAVYKTVKNSMSNFSSFIYGFGFCRYHVLLPRSLLILFHTANENSSWYTCYHELGLIFHNEEKYQSRRLGHV